MSSRPTRARHLVLALVVLLGATAAACSRDSGPSDDPSDTPTASTVRFATFNASLNRSRAGELAEDMAAGNDPQIGAVAEIVQRNHPDVLLVNEFDYYPDNIAVDLFRQNYLSVSQRGQTPIDYPYAYTAPVNTGVPTGRDLDRDGRIDGPGDAYGFGAFPGQYGMVVLSKFPIDTAAVRTFQNFLWKDMPDNLLPRDYYGDNADALRLSSKSHWDVPITVGEKTIHVLASHPTPPSFDGPEDRNGTRNHDEVRLSADYIAGGGDANYIYDDVGVRGGLPEGASFVFLGDQNSDPNDGGSVAGTIAQVLSRPELTDPAPVSDGAKLQASQGHTTPAELDTADFADPDPGNLRVDYVLPSVDLTVTGSAVFWPPTGTDGADLLPPTVSSDHRLVWIDVTVS
ncbi:endonuclease [Rhodococcoides trifolii]|uniref:Endonuclease n=1 Tax=Rhodococcoides trifolii TaxID=908250 RepID=A0A917D6B4_9NOCA|nr:endonuclease/exonuclease/phosphatase family protein [Rhodococcus trifolii]GGG11961.1 endonuclease [Rhodococcus trifolii]